MRYFSLLLLQALLVGYVIQPVAGSHQGSGHTKWCGDITADRVYDGWSCPDFSLMTSTNPKHNNIEFGISTATAAILGVSIGTIQWTIDTGLFIVTNTAHFFIEAIKWVWGAFLTCATWIWETFVKGLEWAWTTYRDWLLGAWELLKNLIKEIWGLFLKYHEWFKETIPAIWVWWYAVVWDATVGSLARNMNFWIFFVIIFAFLAYCVWAAIGLVVCTVLTFLLALGWVLVLVVIGIIICVAFVIGFAIFLILAILGLILVVLFVIIAVVFVLFFAAVTVLFFVLLAIVGVACLLIVLCLAVLLVIVGTLLAVVLLCVSLLLITLITAFSFVTAWILFFGFLATLSLLLMSVAERLDSKLEDMIEADSADQKKIVHKEDDEDNELKDQAEEKVLEEVLDVVEKGETSAEKAEEKVREAAEKAKALAEKAEEKARDAVEKAKGLKAKAKDLYDRIMKPCSTRCVPKIVCREPTCSRPCKIELESLSTFLPRFTNWLINYCTELVIYAVDLILIHVSLKIALELLDIPLPRFLELDMEIDIQISMEIFGLEWMEVGVTWVTEFVEHTFGISLRLSEIINDWNDFQCPGTLALFTGSQVLVGGIALVFLQGNSVKQQLADLNVSVRAEVASVDWKVRALQHFSKGLVIPIQRFFLLIIQIMMSSGCSAFFLIINRKQKQDCEFVADWVLTVFANYIILSFVVLYMLTKAPTFLLGAADDSEDRDTQIEIITYEQFWVEEKELKAISKPKEYVAKNKGENAEENNNSKKPILKALGDTLGQWFSPPRCRDHCALWSLLLGVWKPRIFKICGKKDGFWDPEDEFRTEVFCMLTVKFVAAGLYLFPFGVIVGKWIDNVNRGWLYRLDDDLTDECKKLKNEMVEDYKTAEKEMATFVQDIEESKQLKEQVDTWLVESKKPSEWIDKIQAQLRKKTEKLEKASEKLTGLQNQMDRQKKKQQAKIDQLKEEDKNAKERQTHTETKYKEDDKNLDREHEKRIQEAKKADAKTRKENETSFFSWFKPASMKKSEESAASSKVKDEIEREKKTIAEKRKADKDKYMEQHKATELEIDVLEREIEEIERLLKRVEDRIKTLTDLIQFDVNEHEPIESIDYACSFEHLRKIQEKMDVVWQDPKRVESAKVVKRFFIEKRKFESWVKSQDKPDKVYEEELVVLHKKGTETMFDRSTKLAEDRKVLRDNLDNARDNAFKTPKAEPAAIIEKSFAILKVIVLVITPFFIEGWRVTLIIIGAFLLLVETTAFEAKPRTVEKAHVSAAHKQNLEDANPCNWCRRAQKKRKSTIRISLGSQSEIEEFEDFFLDPHELYWQMKKKSKQIAATERQFTRTRNYLEADCSEMESVIDSLTKFYETLTQEEETSIQEEHTVDIDEEIEAIPIEGVVVGLMELEDQGSRRETTLDMEGGECMLSCCAALGGTRREESTICSL